MTKVSGGCMCGAVRYKAASEPLLTAFCHCRNCQKSGGGGYSANVAVPAASLNVEGELSRYTWSGGSGGSLTKAFCAQCGSPIAIEAQALAGLALVQAGSLDDPSWVEPAVHIWCASAQPWDHIPSGANRAEGAPS